MIQHKEKDGVFKLTAVEKVQILLDESLVTISDLLSSRYIKRLQKEVEALWSLMVLMSETLD